MIRMRKRTSRSSAITLLLAGSCLLVGGQHWLPVASCAEPEDKERRQRLEFMTRQVNQLQLAYRAEPARLLPLTKSPVLRFSNPVRDAFSDGAIFLWLDGRRPVAVASLWINSTGEFGQDFTSLSDQPLRCHRAERLFWTPTAGNLTQQTITDAPQPGASAALRRSQMRQVARRFTGEIGAWPQEGFRKLRLLPQPLYQFTSSDSRLHEGGLFTLAVANDPEVLILIEVLEDSTSQPVWRYSLARMAALKMRIQFDDRDVWSVEGYWRQPRTPDDSYTEIVGERYVPPADPDTRAP